jgi:P2 family phage contractile tail tube protein
MGMPRKLKGFNLFHNGTNFVGQTTEITLPKLSRKMEDYQGGGMSGPIQIDFGQEAIQMEWTCGGFMPEVIAQYGITKHDGVLLRFAGGYQSEDRTTTTRSRSSSRAGTRKSTPAPPRPRMTPLSRLRPSRAITSFPSTARI